MPERYVPCADLAPVVPKLNPANNKSAEPPINGTPPPPSAFAKDARRRQVGLVLKSMYLGKSLTNISEHPSRRGETGLGEDCGLNGALGKSPVLPLVACTAKVAPAKNLFAP